MPKIIDPDNIQWKIDSNNPEQVTYISEDPQWKQHTTAPGKATEESYPKWRPRTVPCLKESIQLSALAGAIIGIGTFFATSRGRLARTMGMVSSAVLFTGTYSICYYYYRKRLKFEYQSQLFLPGKEDEYIIKV